MIKATINTKKMPSGEWSCYTTINGYDKAFVGDFSVVCQMNNWLRDKNVIPKWIEPIIYPPKVKPTKPPIDYQISRIDSGMV